MHGSIAFWACSVTMADFDDAASRKQAGHKVREAMRWKAWQQLGDLKRHELHGQEIPIFSSERLALVRRHSYEPGMFALYTGAIKSAKARKMSDLKHSLKNFQCHRCGSINPEWDQVWTCNIGQSPPHDVLLRRFLWPRARSDLPICRKFLFNLNKIRDSCK